MRAHNTRRTTAPAALAASRSLGMDGTQVRLVADASLNTMVIAVHMEGPRQADGSPGLQLSVSRENPSQQGEVTGRATLDSFFASLLRVAARATAGDGIHLA